MGFMKPHVEHTNYYRVETSQGTEIVPCDVAGEIESVNDLELYLEGELFSEEFEKCGGWIARMSAPGYMDATSWSAHTSEQEALNYLEEMYGNE